MSAGGVTDLSAWTFRSRGGFQIRPYLHDKVADFAKLFEAGPRIGTSLPLCNLELNTLTVLLPENLAVSRRFRHYFLSA
jgi:hypothetical protein